LSKCARLEDLQVCHAYKMHRGNGGTNPHAFLIKGKHHDRAEFKQHYLKPTDNITA